VLHHALDQPLPQPPPAHLRQHVDVAEIGEGRGIGDHPRQTDLPLPLIEAAAERAAERPLQDFPRDPLGPVGGREEGVDRVEVKAGGVGRDGEAVAVMLEAHGGEYKGLPLNA
jgi:hypothetical protein